MRVAAIVLVALALLDLAAPDFWGNERRRQGYLAFVETRDSSTSATVFVGSSRIYRHVDPGAFGPNAFNLGTPATRLIEQSYLLDRLLRQGHVKDGDLVVLEVQAIPRPEPDDVTSIRAIYCQNPMTAFANLKVCRSPLEAGVAVSLPLFRLLKPGAISRSLMAWNVPPVPDQITRHQPLDHETADEYLKRRAGLRADGAAKNVAKRARDYRKAMQADTGRHHRVPAQYLRSMQERCREHGVDVVFLLPPLSDRAYGIIRHLRADSVIDLADPDANPEFYDLDYLYDVGHLNQRGANLFTLRLAARLRDMNRLTGETD